MFYIIYKITNTINGKIYIGKHKTKDLNDDYMGSGKHLRHAIAKYGIENFEKEILFRFDNETEMNTKEAELVTEEFCLKEDNYNLCPGGKGGWGYVNGSKDIRNGFEYRIDYIKHTKEFREWSDRGRATQAKKLKTDAAYREMKSRVAKQLNLKHPNGFLGKSHTEEWKVTQSIIMKERQSGNRNSQFGTMWITDGKDNRKIKKDIDIIPEGWYKGRRC
jgi:hypothetical protein